MAWRIGVQTLLHARCGPVAGRAPAREQCGCSAHWASAPIMNKIHHQIASGDAPWSVGCRGRACAWRRCHCYSRQWPSSLPGPIAAHTAPPTTSMSQVPRVCQPSITPLLPTAAAMRACAAAAPGCKQPAQPGGTRGAHCRECQAACAAQHLCRQAVTRAGALRHVCAVRLSRSPCRVRMGKSILAAPCCLLCSLYAPACYLLC